MVEFVVEQNGGEGWLKLWEASKLRKRQLEGKHGFDPTEEEIKKLESPIKGAEVTMEESPSRVGTPADKNEETDKSPVKGSRWLVAI